VRGYQESIQLSLQDKRAEEEEGKGGQQAELNRPGKEQVRGRRDARLVALAVAALSQALPDVAES
jgi:hypothetical protein